MSITNHNCYYCTYYYSMFIREERSIFHYVHSFYNFKNMQMSKGIVCIEIDSYSAFIFTVTCF